MSSLKTVFILTLIRLNLGEAFLTMKQEWDHYPTEAEMLAFYNGCNEADERHRNFETIMTVAKIYRVVPSETEKPTAFPGWNQIVYGVNPEGLNVRSDIPNEADFKNEYLDTPKSQ